MLNLLMITLTVIGFGVVLLGWVALIRWLRKPPMSRAAQHATHGATTNRILNRVHDQLYAEAKVAEHQRHVAEISRYVSELQLARVLEQTLGTPARTDGQVPTSADVLRLLKRRQVELPLERLAEHDAAQPSLHGSTLVFKADEPQRLRDIIGQQHLVAPLELAITALAPTELVLRHKLLTGPPGFGKTMVAKVLANELQLRARSYGKEVAFVETYGANLNSVDAIDTVVRNFPRDTAVVWFIDEIHVLNKELSTKTYLLMEEGRYPFHGDLNPTPIDHVMIVGATTDYGALHPALKRRFGEGLLMQPLSPTELTRMAQTLRYPITEHAVELLVSRCQYSGAPHELKTLFSECVTYAKAHQEDTITVQAVATVFHTLGIDALGLRPIDRKIITAMLARPRYRGRSTELLGYGGSEHDVCLAAGVDKGEFKDVIRPRLLLRGLLEVRPGIGLALTETAIRRYTP